MRRRRLITATAVALSTPLVAGCSRDGGGDGGGGGPYGMVGAGEPAAAVGPTDREESDSSTGQPGGAGVGDEPDGSGESRESSESGESGESGDPDDVTGDAEDR